MVPCSKNWHFEEDLVTNRDASQQVHETFLGKTAYSDLFGVISNEIIRLKPKVQVKIQTEFNQKSVYTRLLRYRYMFMPFVNAALFMYSTCVQLMIHCFSSSEWLGSSNLTQKHHIISCTHVNERSPVFHPKPA